MRRKRTAKHYSQRHERRLKKQRIEECSAALSWLEEDGLTPVSVTFLNKESNELEKNHDSKRSRGCIEFM